MLGRTPAFAANRKLFVEQASIVARRQECVEGTVTRTSPEGLANYVWTP